MKNMAKNVSVSDELHTLERAVQAARDLARHAEETPDEEVRFTQPNIGAVLDLVAARLHDFGRAVRGEIDPQLFMAPHNRVDEVLDEDDIERQGEDVRLGEWTPQKRRANAQWELQREDAGEKEVKGRMR